MRIIAIIVVALPLSARGLGNANNISQMSPTELKAVDDQRLCRGAPAAHSQAVRDERGARDLSDCSAAAQYCHAKGYVSGTEPYLQCRQTQAAQDAAQQAPQGYTIDEARPPSH